MTTIEIAVRSYELDALGHVNQAVYHQYAELARIASVEASGLPIADFLTAGYAAVLLESHITFRRELRAGDTVTVSCETKFGAGKTFRAEQKITKLDGTLSAELSCTLGLMDLRERRLVADPRATLESLGADPDAM